MVNAIKHILMGILAFAVLLQAFDKGLLWSGFCLNQRYIAEQRCENRSRPELQCEGHCQLRKALEKLDDKKNNPLPKEAKAEILMCEAWKPVSPQPPQMKPEAYRHPTDDTTPSERFPRGILKPPTGLPMA